MQSVKNILKKYRDGEKLAMVTAYDFTAARLLELAEVDMILVGDSVASVVQGRPSTLPVTLEQMAYHSEMVARGAPKTFVVADLPFMSYQTGPEAALLSAGELMKNAGVNAVKLEGGKEVAQTVTRLVQSGIPVMGHLGLLPQSVNISGYALQAKTEDTENALIEDAQSLEASGVFSIVVEKIPAAASERLAKEVSIPIIGIGSGPACSGQVLVFHDLLGFNDPEGSPKFKFVKEYADLSNQILSALKTYISEVKSGEFPEDKHSW